MASNADCASIHVPLPERVGHSTVGSPNPEDSVSETSYDPTLSPRLALLGKQENNQRSDGATSAPRPLAISKPRSTQTTAKSVDASLDREARSQDAVPAIDWPSDGQLTLAWIERLQATFTHATWKLKPEDLPQVFPIQVFEALIDKATRLMQSEQNVVEVNPKHEETVTVVGDVHGQFHDVVRLLERAGQPSERSLFVFNGDYVDRGAWSVETYALLLAWKALLPKHVILIRGNHETKYCAGEYGFQKEVESKYGAHNTRGLFKKLLVCFAAHPLAAVVGSSTYIAHGGLFRESPSRSWGGRKGKKGHKSRKGGKDHHKRAKHGADQSEPLKVGLIAELKKVKRAILDPLDGPNPLPSDVLWSDPGPNAGLVFNDSRGIGLIFGPDCTQSFLEAHRLKLIIRSHEGPDARDKRDGMQGMLSGYCEDHVVPGGKLVTLFSAPDYPQFQVDGEDRYKNAAAYIVLRPPAYDGAEVHHFEAVLPRPEVKAYYDFENALDSDEDLNLGSGSEGSEGSLFSDGSDVES